MNKKSEAVMRSQRRKKQNAVDAFGGKCCLCSYSRCLRSLEFHHLDKDEKEEKPTYIIMRWSWARVRKELDKCILVCSNCHGEIHDDESPERDLSLLNYVRPWLDKTCEFCRESFETKDDAQKYCTSSCYHYSTRKIERPDKETLEELLRTVSWVQVGKMFSVSDNAVRKWAKKYNLI